MIKKVKGFSIAVLSLPVLNMIPRRVIKFGMVGSLGALTNLIIFFFLADFWKISHLIQTFNVYGYIIRLDIHLTIFSMITFFIAATQNYLLNHFWTFKDVMVDDKISFFGFIKFIITSLFGLTVNLLVLNIINHFFPNLPLKVIAQAVGILFGMGFNFLGSKFFVFTKKKTTE